MRKYNPTPAQIRAMETDGMLDSGTRYLSQDHEGQWWRSTLHPATPRDGHGAWLWWYRCLERAKVVPPGTKKGYPMSIARHTVGHRLAEVENATSVRKRLGLGRGGSTGNYENRDADPLDTIIRRVRHQLRPASSDDSHQSTPENWWREPTARLVDYIAEERDLIELSRVSIEMLRSQDPDSVGLRTAAATLTRVVRASKLIDRAEDESHDDYPLLHGHSLVAIWGALETMSIDVVIAFLTHRREARTTEKITQIKVSYSMFEDLTTEERADAIAHQLDRQQDLRSGINRFEELLGAIGLSGGHDPTLAKNIYAMQQMRHVFAHRRGIADATFVDACPHLGYAVGDRILIDRAAWSDFMVNAVVYADVVLRRVKAKLSLPVDSRQVTVTPMRATRVPASGKRRAGRSR
jgi:hypothetical protein